MIPIRTPGSAPQRRPSACPPSSASQPRSVIFLGNHESPLARDLARRPRATFTKVDKRSVEQIGGELRGTG